MSYWLTKLPSTLCCSAAVSMIELLMSEQFTFATSSRVYSANLLPAIARAVDIEYKWDVEILKSAFKFRLPVTLGN